MNLKSNKIYYYLVFDDDAQVFSSISAIKNHLRSRFNIDKRYNLEYRDIRIALDALIKKYFVDEPFYIYEYNVIDKVETKFQLIINAAMDEGGNYYSTEFILKEV